EPSGGLFARAFNVLPGSSEYGPANCFRIDAIHLGDLVVVKALLPQTDKIQHVIGSEFCCWIRAAVRSIGPTLSGHIGRVVSSSSEEQVRRVDAWGVIAGVTHKHAVRNLTDVSHIRHAMSLELFPGYSDCSMPRQSSGAKPYPAGVLVAQNTASIKLFSKIRKVRDGEKVHGLPPFGRSVRECKLLGRDPVPG